MAIVRRINDGDLPDAIRLADTTFRNAAQSSMGAAFPFIFGQSQDHQSLGAFQEDGKLLAFMGLVPWHIRIGHAHLRVFSLGAVCTTPEARGRGLASSLLEQACRNIQQAVASLLLVSGNRSLYARVGCVPFGRVHRYKINAVEAARIADDQAKNDPSTTIREMTHADLFQLQALTCAREVGYEYSVRELAALIKAEAYASIEKRKHSVMIAEKDGAITAFAAFGVPNDQRKGGVLIEYAGQPSAVARLAAEAIRCCGLIGMDLRIPWHERGLLDRLTDCGLSFAVDSNAGTLCIVDGAALIAQLRPWFNDRRPGGEAEELHLARTDEGGWRLSRGKDVVVAKNPEELVRLIFGCGCSTSTPMPEKAEAFSDLFPIPFPSTAGLGYV